jgi:hypothetical protein
MYELRAEYGPAPGAGGERPVRLWHFAEAGTDRSLCDRELLPEAARLPVAEWENIASTGCWTCFSLYVRTLPPPD